MMKNKSQCAEPTIELLGSRGKRIVMGERDKESVRQKFPLPRLLKDHIKVALQ